ncbi:MAG: prepilin peptidase [Kiritimatiellae bacterium]|nr:prepilin peptidase [Kiritimatiellia bacterium]
MSLEAWNAFWALLAFAYGGVTGSFLNVCIWRIPRGESIVRPGSHCPKCGRAIAWYDNIPVMSWLLLGARCRHCAQRISACYPIVELLTALLFLGIWMKYGFDLRTPVFALMAAGLIFGSGVDLRYYILPDRVTVGGILLGLLVSPWIPLLHGASTMREGFISSLTGFAVGFFGLWTVRWAGRMIFQKEAMGFGDVKLMGAVGALMGWPAVVFTVTVSSLFGSLVGLSLILAGKRKWQSRLPFGPFIAAAAMLWALGGREAFFAYWTWASGAGGPS